MRFPRRSARAVWLVVPALAGCGAGPGADLADLAPGWNTIAAGGEAVCSDGSPYEFAVRPGASDRLLFYLQGGGACWDGVSCDPDLEPTPYSVNLDAFDPSQAHGIFAFDEPDNPFREHSVVMAPYCSGDVHLGDAVATYESPNAPGHRSHVVSINHKGFVNVETVLDWTFDRFRSPQSVFVAGSSAGSIPSPVVAMLVHEQYPDADVAQLGDGSGGYRREVMQAASVSPWGTIDVLDFLPEFAGLEDADFSFNLLYTAAGVEAPAVRFAAFDHAEDSVQKDFIAMAGGQPRSLLPLIVSNQDDIRADLPGFRSYIAGGDLHTILLRPQFYLQHVDGRRVRDWVAALVRHERVDNVRCTVCATGQFLQP